MDWFAWFRAIVEHACWSRKHEAPICAARYPPGIPEAHTSRCRTAPVRAAYGWLRFTHSTLPANGRERSNALRETHAGKETTETPK